MYGRYLNPTTDITFKKVFGDKRKKDILIDFLNSVLERKNDDKITEIINSDPNNHPETSNSKLSIVDVRCVDKKGNIYIVEMQVLKQTNYIDRCQYYCCVDVARQLDKTDSYTKLTPVIFIGISNFPLFKNSNYISHHKILNTESHENDLKLMEFHFVELTKFTKNLNELKTVIDQWTYFLKNARALDEIPDQFQKNPAIVHAFEVLEQSNFTKQELKAYDDLTDSYRLEIDRIEGAKLEGFQDASIKIAENLLKAGRLSIKEISENTGLSIDEIEQLKSK